MVLEYRRPANLQEALEFLWEHGPDTALLAGGTDLSVELRSGRLDSRYLLDISRIPEIRQIETRDGRIQIGAAVTFSELIDSKTILRHAAVLRQASLAIGSKQIRNVATLGGNVATSSPAGDSLPALLVLEADVILSSLKSERSLPLKQFLKGPYINQRDPRELITMLVFREAQEGFHAFYKLARRRQLAIARLTVAAVARRGADGRLETIRIGLGAAAPMPFRDEGTEAFLSGRRLSEPLIWEAGRSLSKKMIELSGIRPSTAYKEKALQGLLVKALHPLIGD